MAKDFQSPCGAPSKVSPKERSGALNERAPMGDRFHKILHADNVQRIVPLSICSGGFVQNFFRFCWWPLATQPPLVKLTGMPRTAAA